MTLEELYRVLRSSHVQSQGIVDTLQEPLVVLDKSMAVINANPSFYHQFDTDRESTLGQSLFELGNGQWDIPELRRLLSEVVPKAAAIVGYRVEHSFPDLGPRTMLVSARTLSHPDNNSTQMLVVFSDVTEQQKADTARDMLVAETRHRMKNLMAMLRAVAHQTEAKGRTGEEYRDIFMGRFAAVLTAQEFINFDDSGAGLEDIVSKSLEPLAGRRAVVDKGPKIRLSQYQVTPLTMILHELATNAMKYGALSNDTGLVHVSWSTEQRDGQNYLQVNWREEGGPAVTPPARRGFGTELIEFSAKADGGNAVIDFQPAGLHVQLNLLAGA